MGGILQFGDCRPVLGVRGVWGWVGGMGLVRCGDVQLTGLDVASMSSRSLLVDLWVVANGPGGGGDHDGRSPTLAEPHSTSPPPARSSAPRGSHTRQYIDGQGGTHFPIHWLSDGGLP